MLAQGAAAEDRFQCIPQSDGQNHQVSVVLYVFLCSCPILCAIDKVLVIQRQDETVVKLVIVEKPWTVSHAILVLDFQQWQREREREKGERNPNNGQVCVDAVIVKAPVHWLAFKLISV